MPQVELTFEVAALSEDTEDLLVEILDATIARHQGVDTVTVLVDAPDVPSAGFEAVDALFGLAVNPLRLIDDLVGRSEIASRVGVTRQAVGHWIAGLRHPSAAFPKPFVLSGGGLWRWNEVLSAVRSLGYDVDDNATYPSRDDAVLIASYLISQRDTHSWVTARTRVQFETLPSAATYSTYVQPHFDLLDAA